MSEASPRAEFLVLSRGQWDGDDPREEIQKKIDEFYGRLILEGRARTGQRLFGAGRTVSRRAVTDGPFGEAEEVVGGDRTFLAGSLEEAVESPPAIRA